MYQAEAVPYESIKFRDNQGCIDLIEAKKVSVLASLDEEGNVPGGSDDKWISKLHKTFSEDPKTSSEYYGRDRKRPHDFVVHHFAASVNYCSEGFLEKNKDEIDPLLVQEISRSKSSLLRQIFQGLVESRDQPASTKKKAKATLGFKFKSDLEHLMRTLGETTPHFIRCVKPNQEKVPRKFTSPICLEQLKNAGLFEAIRIRKAGYLYRLPAADFVHRYKCCPRRVPPNLADSRGTCQFIVDELARELRDSGDEKLGVLARTVSGDLAVGKTRVFIKTLAAKRVLEDRRSERLSRVVVMLQATARMMIVYNRWVAFWPGP